LGDTNYVGLDANQHVVAWCKRYIEARHPRYRFTHVNVSNERYNPNGRPLNGGFAFEVQSSSIDIVYLYSVFSHMHESDMLTYIRECARVLKPRGYLFATAFLANDVPDVSVNPPGYVFDRYDGPLHVVRYRTEYLTALWRSAGLLVRRMNIGAATDGQTELYLQPEA
jgi:SAM-dependent methyltransferase